jgi:hypothetical protein
MEPKKKEKEILGRVLVEENEKEKEDAETFDFSTSVGGSDSALIKSGMGGMFEIQVKSEALSACEEAQEERWMDAGPGEKKSPSECPTPARM